MAFFTGFFPGAFSFAGIRNILVRQQIINGAACPVVKVLSRALVIPLQYNHGGAAPFIIER